MQQSSKDYSSKESNTIIINMHNIINKYIFTYYHQIHIYAYPPNHIHTIISHKSHNINISHRHVRLKCDSMQYACGSKLVIISGKPIVQLQGLDNHHKAPFGVKLYKPHSALGLGQANNLQEITQHCLFSKTSC